MANELQTSPVLTSAFGDNPLTAAIVERYLHEKVLSVAMKDLVFWKLGRKVKMPENSGITISFERFERLVAPRRRLTEGVTPAGKKMRCVSVLAVLEQWGDFITFTDRSQYTVAHEPVQRGLELIGLDAAETVDRETQRTLRAGTNVFFPNDRTDRTQLQVGDFPTTKLLRKCTAFLQRSGAPAYEGGRFVGVADPENIEDIAADSTFVPAAQYSNLTALQDAEVGVWLKVRWMMSNNIPVLILDTDLDPTSVAVAAASGSETALVDGTYAIRLIGMNTAGFETNFSDASSGVATTTDVLAFTVPTLPDGMEAVNIYASKDGGAFTLQAVDQPAGSYTLNAGGIPSSGTGIEYTSDGETAEPIPPADVNVHSLYIMGNEYFSCVELKAIQILRTPSGPAKGDELDQRASIGWKLDQKCLITNQSYGLRIECESDYD